MGFFKRALRAARGQSPDWDGEHRVYVYDLTSQDNPVDSGYAAICECGWVEVTTTEEEARACALTHSQLVADRLFYEGDMRFLGQLARY